VKVKVDVSLLTIVFLESLNFSSPT